MPWVPAALMFAGSVYSADKAKDANKDATRSQRQATNAQINFQRNAAIAALKQSYPIYTGQINALNRLYGMQRLPSIEAASLNSLLGHYNTQTPDAPKSAVKSVYGIPVTMDSDGNIVPVGG